MWARSSIGRAPDLHSGGCRFDPDRGPPKIMGLAGAIYMIFIDNETYININCKLYVTKLENRFDSY